MSSRYDGGRTQIAVAAPGDHLERANQGLCDRRRAVVLGISVTKSRVGERATNVGRGRGVNEVSRAECSPRPEEVVGGTASLGNRALSVVASSWTEAAIS